MYCRNPYGQVSARTQRARPAAASGHRNCSPEQAWNLRFIGVIFQRDHVEESDSVVVREMKPDASRKLPVSGSGLLRTRERIVRV